MRTLGILSLCVLTLLAGAPLASADCRTRVCNNVAAVKTVAVVEQAFIATFAAFPVFQVGYAPVAPPAAAPAVTSVAPDRLAKLEQEVARLKQENETLRAGQGGVVQASNAGALAFLNGCTVCHAAAKKSGNLDLTLGLAALSCEQLTAMLTRTYDKDAEDAMPPKASQGKHPPLDDKQYAALVKAVNAALKTAKK